MWLLHWEFSDTVIIMLREKVIFGVSPKKGKQKTRAQFHIMMHFVLIAHTALYCVYSELLASHVTAGRL